MGNTMWHVALKPGTTEMQDVVVAELPFGDMDLTCMLLKAEKLRGKTVETERGNYLLMIGAEYERPYPSVMIWRYRIEGEESRVEDMRMEDAWFLKYVWKAWLMPPDSDAEFIPPKSFIIMERSEGREN